MFSIEMALKNQPGLIKIIDAIECIEKSLSCAICLEISSDPVETRCGHLFCRTCIQKVLNHPGESCPVCKFNLTRRSVSTSGQIGLCIQEFSKLLDAIRDDSGIDVSSCLKTHYKKREFLPSLCPRSSRSQEEIENPPCCESDKNTSKEIPPKEKTSPDELPQGISPGKRSKKLCSNLALPKKSLKSSIHELLPKSKLENLRFGDSPTNCVSSSRFEGKNLLPEDTENISKASRIPMKNMDVLDDRSFDANREYLKDISSMNENTIRSGQSTKTWSRVAKFGKELRRKPGARLHKKPKLCVNVQEKTAASNVPLDRSIGDENQDQDRVVDERSANQSLTNEQENSTSASHDETSKMVCEKKIPERGDEETSSKSKEQEILLSKADRSNEKNVAAEFDAVDASETRKSCEKKEGKCALKAKSKHSEASSSFDFSKAAKKEGKQSWEEKRKLRDGFSGLDRGNAVSEEVDNSFEEARNLAELSASADSMKSVIKADEQLMEVTENPTSALKSDSGRESNKGDRLLNVGSRPKRTQYPNPPENPVVSFKKLGHLFKIHRKCVAFLYLGKTKPRGLETEANTSESVGICRFCSSRGFPDELSLRQKPQFGSVVRWNRAKSFESSSFPQERRENLMTNQRLLPLAEIIETRTKESFVSNKGTKESFASNKGTKESVDSNKGTKESVDSNKGTKESVDSNKGTKESFDLKKGTKESVDSNKGTKESFDLNKGSKESVDSNKGTKESFDLNKGSKESVDSNKGTKESFDLNKGTKESVDSNKATKESFDLNKGTKEFFDRNKGTKESFDLNKGTKESFDLNKGTKETFDLNKGTKESFDRSKGTKESFDRNKGTKESFDPNIGTKESFDSNKGTKESFADKSFGNAFESKIQAIPSEKVALELAPKRLLDHGESPDSSVNKRKRKRSASFDRDDRFSIKESRERGTHDFSHLEDAECYRHDHPVDTKTASKSLAARSTETPRRKSRKIDSSELDGTLEAEETVVEPSEDDFHGKVRVESGDLNEDYETLDSMMNITREELLLKKFEENLFGPKTVEDERPPNRDDGYQDEENPVISAMAHHQSISNTTLVEREQSQENEDFVELTPVERIPRAEFPHNWIESKSAGTPLSGISRVSKAAARQTPAKMITQLRPIYQSTPKSSKEDSTDRFPSSVYREKNEAKAISSTINLESNEIPKSLGANQTTGLRGCILCSGLTTKQSEHARFLSNLFNIRYTKKFSDEVTHVIVNTNDENNGACKTLKYLQGVAYRKWVLNFKWIVDCATQRKLLNEEPYEVVDSTTLIPGPRKARTREKAPFENFAFYCVEPFQNISVPDYEDLLRHMGATVVESLSELADQETIFKIIAVQAECHEKKIIEWHQITKAVPVAQEWIVECISQYRLVSLLPFLQELVPQDVLDLGFPEELIQDDDSDFMCDMSG